MMKVGLGAAMMVAAMVFFFFSPRTCDADRDGSRQVMRQKPPSGKPGQGNATATQNMTYHGGPVMPMTVTYPIYWGNQSAFPSDLKTGLAIFFGGFGNSGYSDILAQYLLGAPSTLSSHGSVATDPSSPPSRSPSVSTIVNEACKFISGTPDPDGVYFVISSNFPRHANFCAWHSAGTCNGASI